MVLLLDEADAIAKARDDRNDVGELGRVVNALLQAMDYFAPKQSVVILASNHSHMFDPAVWRRFDEIVEFPHPGHKEREAQLRFLTGGLNVVVIWGQQLANWGFARTRILTAVYVKWLKPDC